MHITYPKIYAIHNESCEGILDGTVFIQSKIDGCFRYNTYIDTEEGSITIGDIVDKGLNPKVLSLNSITNKLEYKSITNRFKNGKTTDWIKVKFKLLEDNNELECTPNHMFYYYNNNELQKKPISEFKVGDTLLYKHKKFSNIQKQVMLGSYLGDGTFYNVNKDNYQLRFAEVHGIAQEEYCIWKSNILGNSKLQYHLGRYSKEHSLKQKIRFHMRGSVDKEYIKKYYINNNKVIHENIVTELDWLSIAIWYQDDGSIGYGKQKPRACFHSSGFSIEENKLLIKALETKGIDATCITTGRGHNRICISSNSNDIFFNGISEYIHPCMQYKIPKEYRKEFILDNINNDEQLFQCEITSLEQIKRRASYKYDIEVEDNHNYFVKGVLVSNCNLSIRLEDGELAIGSRTQIVYSAGTLHKKFNNVQNVIPAHAGIMKLLEDHPTYRLYGEFLVKHTISYPEDAYNKFYMFDILDGETRLDPVYVRELALKYGIDTPSNLSNGYNHFTLERLNEIMKDNKDFGVRGEGIVIKPYDFINKRGNKQYGKLVRPEFKEENSIVFGNINKTSPEDEFASKYINAARVLKIINKIEQNEDRNIKIEDTPIVNGMCYHDAFEEELRGFCKKKTIDFQLLCSKCNHRSKSLFHRYLNEGNLSDNSTVLC